MASALVNAHLRGLPPARPTSRCARAQDPAMQLQPPQLHRAAGRNGGRGAGPRPRPALSGLLPPRALDGRWARWSTASRKVRPADARPPSCAHSGPTHQPATISRALPSLRPRGARVDRPRRPFVCVRRPTPAHRRAAAARPLFGSTGWLTVPLAAIPRIAADRAVNELVGPSGGRAAAYPCTHPSCAGASVASGWRSRRRCGGQSRARPLARVARTPASRADAARPHTPPHAWHAPLRPPLFPRRTACGPARPRRAACVARALPGPPSSLAAPSSAIPRVAADRAANELVGPRGSRGAADPRSRAACAGGM